MIQIILKMISMFCRFGGPFVAPIIMPLINPLSWTTLTLCVFLPIYFSNVNQLNSEDGKEKNSTTAFKFAFIIHYAICVLCLCSVMQSVCSANNKYNPY